MRVRNDIFWKGLLEELFPDFLRFYFPALYAIVDFDKGYEFLDKELQQLFPEKENILHPRFVDKLVKLFTLSGEEKWVLIHIEVQGYEDVNFPSRMFTYFYRILDKYQKPVTALAIYTDTNPAYCPKEYKYSFMGTEAAYRFNTYKILQQNEEALDQSDNPFAIAVLTVLLALKSGKLDDGNLLSLKLDLVKNYCKRTTPKKKAGRCLTLSECTSASQNRNLTVNLKRKFI